MQYPELANLPKFQWQIFNWKQFPQYTKYYEKNTETTNVLSFDSKDNVFVSIVEFTITLGYIAFN